MGLIKRKKCLHCKQLYKPDARNAKRQKYCIEPACRKAGKAESQRRWLQKPDNIGYFKGPENVKRVQLWRKANPGYWRRKPPKRPNTLQDSLIPETTEIIEEYAENANYALQDSLIVQPAVLIGLISNFSGSALQDDIANTLRHLQKLGRDIMNLPPADKGDGYANQNPHQHPQTAQSAPAVQLGRSPTGP